MRWLLMVVVVALATLFPLIAVASVPDTGCQVEIVLGSPERHVSVRGELRLRPTDAEKDQEWLSLQATGKRLHAQLTPGSWILEASPEGFWAPTQILNVGQPCESRVHHLPLLPLGKLAGHFKVESGKARSSSKKSALRKMEALFRSSRNGPPGSSTAGRTFCSLEAERSTWECELPEGSYDIVFSASDFAPIYRSRVTIESDSSTGVADLVFKPGASLVGRVDVEDGEVMKCQASLRRPGQARVGVRARKRQPLAQVDVGADGFFQLAGLQAGDYELEVEQPGYAPIKVFPVELFEGRETRLRETILLQRPLDLEFSLTPPVDWMSEPWQARLSRASAQSASFENKPVFEGDVPVDGRLEVEGQAPGRYYLTISDSLGSRFYSDAFLSVEPDTPQPMVIDLEVISLEGSMKLGDEPVPGTLWFGGQYGREAVAVPVDAEGHFQGVLPRDGGWEVEVEASELDLMTFIEVEIDADSRGRASLEITLPDTHLQGQVLDGAGQPVDGARIMASFEQGSVASPSLRTENGSFELRGLPEGLTKVSAHLEGPEGELNSRTVAVTLHEDLTENVVLRLEKMTQVTGSVVGPRGPIPGAKLTIEPVMPPFRFSSQARTGADGRASWEVAASVQRARVTVSAPGHALKAFEVDFENSQELLFEVPEGGGSLSLDLPARKRTSEAPRFLFDVMQDGVLLAPHVLYEWYSARGGGYGTGADGRPDFELRHLAPGHYRVCLYPRRSSVPVDATASEGEVGQDPRERRRAQGECFEDLLVEGGSLVHAFGEPEEPSGP